MDTITFLIVVSDSKISVASATLALIWRSHIDLSLVSPFPSTTTVNSMPSSYGGHACFQLPWILLCRTPSWIHIPALPTHFLRHFCRICACWPVLLLQLLQLHPFSSTIQHNSSFFFQLFPFFLSKNVVRCHAIQRWGDQLKMGRFCRSLLERLNL